MPDIIGVGESDVDLYLEVEHPPRRGEKIRAREIGRLPGGMIGNFCACVAESGVSCGIVSLLGDDENGRIALADYQRRGIDTSGLQVVPGGRTFYCVVFLDGSGEKYLTAVPTPLITPRPEQVPPAYLRQAKFVHLNAMDRELAVHVAGLLDRSKTGLSLDYEAHGDAPGFESWEPVLRRTRMLFLNEDGLAGLLPGLPLESAAQRLLALGISCVAVTLAERGGAVFTREKSCRYRAFRPARVADTTGAGDCFNAAFLSRLVLGDALEQAACYAAAAAALSIQEVGARTGLPSAKQVHAFLQSGPEMLL